MVESFTDKFVKSDVVESPKDVILDGVVIKIDKGQLKEFVPKEKWDKFDNLEQETLLVHFETAFKGRNLTGSDKISYYPKGSIPSNSNLGKFIQKYDSIAVGVKIKVEFDGNGYSSIKLK